MEFQSEFDAAQELSTRIGQIVMLAWPNRTIAGVLELVDFENSALDIKIAGFSLVVDVTGLKLITQTTLDQLTKRPTFTSDELTDEFFMGPYGAVMPNGDVMELTSKAQNTRWKLVMRNAEGYKYIKLQFRHWESARLTWNRNITEAKEEHSRGR